MIIYSDESLFEVKCNALVCPVNCTSIRAGLASEMTDMYPTFKKDFANWKQLKLLRPERVLCHIRYVPFDSANTKFLICMVTKEGTGSYCKLDALDKCLAELVNFCNKARMPKIAIAATPDGLYDKQPKKKVDALLKKYFSNSEFVDVIICASTHKPNQQTNQPTKEPEPCQTKPSPNSQQMLLR